MADMPLTNLRPLDEQAVATHWPGRSLFYECSRGPFVNLSDLPLGEAERAFGNSQPNW
jgi:hypothetical protein